MNSNFTENDIKANINKQEIRNCEIEKIILQIKKSTLEALANLIVAYSILVQFSFFTCWFMFFSKYFFAPCCFKL